MYVPCALDQPAFRCGNSRLARTLWLPHFPQRSRFTKDAIDASGLIPRRTKSDPVRRPMCRQLRHSTLIGSLIFSGPNPLRPHAARPVPPGF